MLSGQSQPPVWLGLFADENKDAGDQRDDVDEEDSWPERQTEPEQAMENQINREQKHADVFGEFHDVDLFYCLPG